MPTIETKTFDAALDHLNRLDFIPVVSTFSGALRIIVGVIEIVVAVIFTLISLASPCCGGWENLDKNLLAILHGLGEIGKGAIFAIPIAGNLAAGCVHIALPATYLAVEHAPGAVNVAGSALRGFYSRW